MEINLATEYASRDEIYGIHSRGLRELVMRCWEQGANRRAVDKI